jgi:hypothetical protein
MALGSAALPLPHCNRATLRKSLRARVSPHFRMSTVRVRLTLGKATCNLLVGAWLEESNPAFCCARETALFRDTIRKSHYPPDWGMFLLRTHDAQALESRRKFSSSES